MAILSISKEANFLKVALLIPEKKLFRILFLKEFSLEDFEVTDLLYTIKKQTGLSYKDIDVISPLKTKDVSIKETKFPFKNTYKIRKALEFFSLENFYFSKENLIISSLTKSSNKFTNSYLYATSKHLISKHVDLFKDLDLALDSLTCIPAALSAFACNFCNASNPVFVINVGFDQLDMAYVKNQFATQCFSYPIGLKNFIDVLIDNDFAPSKIDADLINEIIETITAKKNYDHPLKNSTTILKQTIERFIDSCMKKQKHEKPIALLFTGYGFIIEKAFCLNHYSIAKETTKHHIEYDAYTLKRYAIELGSALQLTKSCSNQLLFPIKANPDTKMHKKIKSMVKTSAFLMLTLFALLSCFSSLTLIKQKKRVTKAIEVLANKMHLKEKIAQANSIEHSLLILKNWQKKEHLNKMKEQKIQSLGQILKSIYQSSNGLKLHSFDYKREKTQQVITFKVLERNEYHEKFIENLKKKHQKNLLSFQENDNIIQYSLKY